MSPRRSGLFRGLTAAASLKRGLHRAAGRSPGALFRGLTAAASLKRDVARRPQAQAGLAPLPRPHRRGLIEAAQ